jgi:hypothetical protein
LDTALKPADIEKCLRELDGRGSDAEWAAVAALEVLGAEFPALLLQAYRQARKWGARASCVYHAIKYSRTSRAAFQLGIEALGDRSKYVRYRACMLLSVAQRPEALGTLQALLNDPDSADDAKAAIEAIEHHDQNLFVDREHSGKISLRVRCVS